MKFYISGVDAELHVQEFLFAIVAGGAVVGFPLIVKSLLLFLGF